MTLGAWRVADALAEWVLAQPGNGEVQSVNPVAGECNGGCLAAIRKRPGGRERLLAPTATDAPGDARQLGRIAARMPMGLSRAGGFAAKGSGDYAIAVTAVRLPQADGRMSGLVEGFTPA